MPMYKYNLKLEFGSNVLKWFKINKRDLPFRKDKDPYKVWLSEIILQQTQMDTGIRYYKRFIKTFPNIIKLSEASEENVYSMWKGLGYYNRAKNLHKTAKIITTNFKGIFPTDYDELLKLPGIGKYTASAISSICFKERRFVIDANVFRVISRYVGVKENISKPNSYDHFEKISKKLAVKVEDIGLYNEALMDFGSLVCRPKKPKCNVCNNKKTCYSFINNTQEKYPIKEKIKKRKRRYFNYFAIENKSKYLIQKRTKKDIWNNLYEFFLIEDKNTSAAINLFKKNTNIEVGYFKPENTLKRLSQLSHQSIRIIFYRIFIRNKRDFCSIKKNLALKEIEKGEIQKVGFPKVIDNYLKYNS